MGWCGAPDFAAEPNINIFSTVRDPISGYPAPMDPRCLYFWKESILISLSLSLYIYIYIPYIYIYPPAPMVRGERLRVGACVDVDTRDFIISSCAVFCLCLVYNMQYLLGILTFLERTPPGSSQIFKI